MDSEQTMAALDGIRDAIFLAKDEVGRTDELSIAAWQRIADNCTVLYWIVHRSEMIQSMRDHD